MKPTISQTCTPTKPADRNGTQTRPKTMIAIVTTMSVRRRPKRSAQGPETRVKIPKNNTPTIIISTKLV